MKAKRTEKQKFAHAYNWLRGQLRFKNWVSAINLYPTMNLTVSQHLALLKLNAAHRDFHKLIENSYEEVKKRTFPEDYREKK